MAPVTCSFEETCTAVDAAVHRNDIAKAIMHYSIGRFEGAALFMVRAGHAIGWFAQAPGLGEDALQRLNLPLGAASVFQTAHDSRKPYRGPPITPGAPLEKELWSLFAIDHEPTDLHVIPISIGDRVVNLLYAHSVPGAPVGARYASELLELATIAEGAYKRMIARASKPD
jgi:hypothetical protein